VFYGTAGVPLSATAGTAAIVQDRRLGGFEPNIPVEVQLQQMVLSLVDEGGALMPASSAANRNQCLARFLELA